MNSEQLQAQLNHANTALQEARRAASGLSEDVEASINAETRVGAAERVVARLEAQLSEQMAWEKADEKRRLRLEQETRKAELEQLHLRGCDKLALIVDNAARSLEPVLGEVMTRRAELGRMAEEHYRLLQQLTGEARPDTMLRLGAPTLIPTFEEVDGSEFSPLYAAVVSALTTATRLTSQALVEIYTAHIDPTGADLSQSEGTEQAS